MQASRKKAAEAYSESPSDTLPRPKRHWRTGTAYRGLHRERRGIGPSRHLFPSGRHRPRKPRASGGGQDAVGATRTRQL